jgi:hypothetical protein
MSMDMQELTGFSEEDLLAMLKPAEIEGLTDEDAAPEPPEKPVTVLGDVWLLGAEWECTDCGKTFSYKDGLPYKDEGCPCGEA